MQTNQQGFVIVGSDGKTEHEFPAGMDPKKAAEIVRRQETGVGQQPQQPPPQQPAQPANQPSVKNERGFFSAAGDIMRSIPAGVVGMAEEGLSRMFPANPVLSGRSTQRQVAAGSEFAQGVEEHGLPAEVVHFTGQQLGIPSHDIRRDYEDENWRALAGDIAAPITLGELARKGVETYPAVKSAFDARKAAKYGAAQQANLSSLMKAIPPTKSAAYSPDTLKRATPYLEAEHRANPIQNVESLRDSIDSAVTQIEEHIGQYVNAYPNDFIETNPLASVRRALSGNPRSSAMQEGIKAVSDLGLDKPLTVAQADAIRLQLNAENKAVLKKNNYDVSTARRADPAFAAREAASEALRDGVYNKLEARGVEGVRELRLDEGALLQFRNAVNNQIFAGDRAVAGTGASGPVRRMVGRGVRLGSTAAGATVAGPTGAVGGAMIGEELSRMVSRPNATRDAIVAKVFERLNTGQTPQFPAMPKRPVIRGELPAPARPMQSAPDSSRVTTGEAALGDFKVYPTPPQRLLNAPPRPMGAKPDASGVSVIEARGIVVRDPKTGRFKRVYTTETKK